MIKEVVSGLAVGLTFYAFFPYIRSIHAGKTKPHAFSWIIWGATTFIVFFAQISDGAGIGAWPIGISGAISLYVAILAYCRRSDSSTTRLDWLFFILALAALPVWFFTSDPLWAVIILTIVDLLGFGPTVRKAFFHPHQEKIGFFTLFAVRNFLAIIALENYSVTTVLFPAVVGLACVLLVIMIAVRRVAAIRREPVA